jgi:ribosomal protein S21
MLIVVVKGNIEKSLKELKGKVIKTKQTKKLLELKEFDKKSVIKRKKKLSSQYKQKIRTQEQ